MKINRILLYNINSLKGRHEINFEEEPLRSAGLFAITGATGSGKSTILDVITLALYNEVPRLGKLSKKNIQTMGSIVTNFADEAWAEVEYTAKGLSFRSRWSIRITRTGNLSDYDMEIVSLPDEKSLGILKGSVPAKNRELIGLTYEQFMRSILLSQGAFSQFLLAKKEDRAKLLEDITGTEIYRHLGKLAYELTKERKNEVDKIREKIEEISILSDEELNENQALLKQLNQDAVAAQQKYDAINKIIRLQEINQEIELTKQTIVSKKTQLDIKAEAMIPMLEKYAIHQEAKIFEKSIIDLDQQVKQLETLDRKKSDNEKFIHHTTISKSTILTEMSSFVQQKVAEQNFLEIMEAFEKEIIQYDQEKDSIQTKGQELRTRINRLTATAKSNGVSINITENIKPADAIDIIKQRRNNLQVTVDDKLDVLRNQWEEINSRKSVLKEYSKIYDENERLLHLVDTQIRSEKSFQTQFDSYSKLNKDLLTKEKEDEVKLNDLKTEHEAARSKASYEEQRSGLKDNEPCPLCGSTEHPYNVHKIFTDLGMMSANLKRLELEFEKLKAEIKQNTTNLLTTEIELKSIKEKILETKLKANQLDLLLQKNKADYPWILQIADEKWKVQIEFWAAELEQLFIKQKQLQESKYLEEVLLEFEELDKISQEYVKINSVRQNKYSGKDVSKDANLFQNKYTTIVEKLNNLELEKQTLIQETTAVKASIQVLFDLLEKLKEQFDLASVYDCKSLLLEHQDLTQINKERELLSVMETEINTIIKSNQEKEAHYLKNVKDLNEKELILLSYEILELKTIQVLLQNNLKDANQKIGSIHTKLKDNDASIAKLALFKADFDKVNEQNKTWILLNNIIGDSEGKKFANYAQDLTLSHLLDRANAQLMNLSDRYLLDFSPDEEDLYVIDMYQGETKRAVKTLSGGETFLISLALALSLSDFASKTIRLESLFIDEGFGTLDPETLDVAMSTLEKLQNKSGKRIGIISHVESLKERISTQIQVLKSTQGYSHLEISLN